jgi:rhamnulokinase
LLPGDMPTRINAQLQRSGRPPLPDGAGMAPKMTSLILHSLAARYAAVLENASSISGRTFRRLYVVGGGSKNKVLNQLTASVTGLEVLTGSTESATVGNFAIQLAALEGKYTNNVGVAANAVAEWAAILAIQPIENIIPVHRVEEIQRPNGKALA